MKKRNPAKPILIASLFSLFLVGCQSEVPKNEPELSDYNHLKELFKDPPAEYRSAPLWDWNDKITQEGIDFQMQKFKEGGIGGVFIHPRPGLITEYLSEDWNRLYDHTIKKAKELGMKVWIYDENSYPSGFAGGHVPAQMPESYKYGTGLSYEVQDVFKPDTSEYEVILKQNEKGFKNITGDYKMELGSKGKYYLFKKTYSQKSYWYGNYPYVDLLYKGVTQKFMDLTMKGYEQYNKQDFGKTLMGIFTDEPNLEAAMDRKITAFRWTPDLFVEFKKRWGYDLETNLPGLVEEVGNWKKVRHDYYVTLLEMFLDRWSKPWSRYCEANHLAWTGHYWEHGWPKPTEGIDEAAFYIYHQQPGIDMLGNEMIPNGRGGQFGNTRAVRELLSAANQAGRSRRLSETYGGAGWETDFRNFKRLVDWEVVLGVNFVNQHLSYYTMKGVRKFDYPPTFSYQEPWWNDYKMMGDYIGRICLITTAGEQINKTLVLQPNTTAWMYFSRKVNNSRVDTIQNDFKTFVYNLERNHYEYDLGSEQVLRTIGSVKGANLVVGQRSYDLVIIPKTMESVDNSTCELLKEYLSKGGKILSFTKNISLLDGAPSEKVNQLMKDYSKQWSYAENMNDEPVRKMLAVKEFSIEEPQSSGELYHQRRIMKDGELVFLVNSDTSKQANAIVHAVGKTVLRMDPETGKTFLVQTKAENNQLSFTAQLPPVGSAIYYISNQGVSEPADKPVYKDQKAINPDGSMEIKPEDENVLVVDYLDLKTKEIEMPNTYFMKAMYKLYEVKKFPMGNPWQHKIQYKQDYLALDTFKVGSGFEVSFHFNIAGNANLKDLASVAAVVERPELWKVYLNGKPVSKNGQWWVDQQFYRFPIGDQLKKGENTLTLKADRMSVHAELMPVYILGNFLLKTLPMGFEITNGTLAKTGSWKSLGYPFYSQKVSYKQTFTLPQIRSEYLVSLKNWRGITAEVSVNGQRAGLLSWAPYQLNVRDLLKEGKNEIVVTVVGSLKNSFGYFYKDNKRSINGPGDWNTAPDQTPALSQYYTMDYGLFEPFSLLESN